MNRTGVNAIARVYRGNREESIHYGSIAVVDKNGKLTHYLGDPEFFTFTRSSAKPFQLIPLVLTGAADKYNLNLKQLAVMCGSHSGTDHHRAIVQANLEVAGNKPENLKCGAHVPIYMQASGEFPMHGEDKDSLRHNCSGKHSGFLALARFLGDDVSRYLDPNSKAQQMVLDAVANMYEYPKEEIEIGIDGCSSPNFGMPMIHTAVAFMKLANARGDSPGLSKALVRIKKAMSDYPEMVSGEGRFDMAVMRTFPGNVVCKIGAESIEGIGFSDPPIGIVVKVHDGNQRALNPVCVEVMIQLGLIKIETAEHLRPFYNPETYNDMHLHTGSVRAEFKLHEA